MEADTWEGLLDRCEGTFGQRPVLWCPAEGWLGDPSALPGASPLSTEQFLPTLLQSVPRLEESVSSAGEKKGYWLYLPIPVAGRGRILGIFHFAQLPPEWIERLANLFLRNHRLESQCHSHEEQLQAAMTQISSDFEQQTFLRFLAEQIELCDISRGVSHVLSKVLPRLRRAATAQAVIFVPTSARTTRSLSDEWRIEGEIPVDAPQCLDLIDHFDLELVRGPVVRNRGFSIDSNALPAGVSNFMMVSVERETTSLGWLVAFNRVAGHLVENELDNGFGTVEAGLLQVTSTIVSTHGRNIQLFHESEELTVSVVRTLVSAIEARDSYTRGHSERVGQLAQQLGERMGLSREEAGQLYVAGLMHDIGKIGVPDEILRKEGKLTREEFDEIKKHPEIGFEILRGLRKFSFLLPGVLHHHERIDGQGYPHGLSGNDIPLQARILAVVDGWDAMTSARPYRDAMDSSKAREILWSGRGTQWDKDLVEAFLSAQGEGWCDQDKAEQHAVGAVSDDRKVVPAVAVARSSP